MRFVPASGVLDAVAQERDLVGLHCPVELIKVRVFPKTGGINSRRLRIGLAPG